MKFVFPPTHIFDNQDGTISPVEMARYLCEKKQASILQSPEADFEEDMKCVQKINSEPILYFSEPFSLVLNTPPQEQKIFEIKTKESKNIIREQVEMYAREHGNEACVESCLSIFEELFMNAMIDAPREFLRAKPGIGIEKPCYLRIAIDQRRLALSMQDPYGSLDPNKLLSRMVQVYSQGAGQAINLNQPGGAGIGCVLMLEQSASLVFAVKKFEQTIVTAQVYRQISRRKKDEIAKSMHIILVESEKADVE